MAYLVSVTAWNSNNLNFNAPFAGGATTTVTHPASALGSFSGDKVINGVTYSFAAQQRSVNSEVGYDWPAGNMAQVIGVGRTVDPSGTVLAGNVFGLGLTLGDQFTYGFSGFRYAGSGFGAAQISASTADDIGVFNQIMRFNDLVFLSGQNDSIATNAGKDLVFAGTGNDAVSGGAGNDLFNGEAGNDSLVGGSGNDLLFGGANADRFVFGNNDGTDRIKDFAIGDRIVITDPTIRMANVTISQSGAHSSVHFGNTTVIVENIAPAFLTAARFTFDGDAQVNTAVSGFFTNWDYFV